MAGKVTSTLYAGEFGAGFNTNFLLLYNCSQQTDKVILHRVPWSHHASIGIMRTVLKNPIAVMSM